MRLIPRYGQSYAKGGLIGPATVAVNETGEPERVWPPDA